MKQEPSTSEDEGPAPLRTYLHDHSAGAEHARLLLGGLRDQHAGTPLGYFAARLLVQVEADLEVLKRVAERAGAPGFQVKEVGGWIADKLSRLKLAPLGSPFDTL